MVGSILFVGVVGLVSPVDANFLSSKCQLKREVGEMIATYVGDDTATIETLHGSLGRKLLFVLDETVVETSG